MMGIFAMLKPSLGEVTSGSSVTTLIVEPDARYPIHVTCCPALVVLPATNRSVPVAAEANVPLLMAIPMDLYVPPAVNPHAVIAHRASSVVTA